MSREARSRWGMAAIAWVTVITGSFIVYPWYRTKTRASFLDMLTTLRRESVRNQFLSLGLSGGGSRKALQAIENAVSLAI